MKPLKINRIFRFLVLMIAIVSMASSCKKDGEQQPLKGDCTISGVVTDRNTGTPLAGVTVSIKGMTETATSGNDGKYTLQNVTKEPHAVVFSRTNYQTVGITVTAKDFDSDNKTTLNATMLYATAKIVGVVTDAKNNNAPLAGVTVSIGPLVTVTTGADGKYALENLLVDDYTVTFTKLNYVTVTRPIAKTDFVVGTATVATLDIPMGGAELLRGLTAIDLAGADKWYYNEYRGGGNADAYPHWDWACDYMCSNTYVGDWQEQWEGTTLRIRNDATNQKNPANLDVFDSYTYGSKKITTDNKIMSLRIRTHNADATAPAYFGVQVIDLSAAEPKAVKIGDVKTYGSDVYTDFDFDLSAYIGKEVIIAVGIYRQSTGDYLKQLVLRAIRFASQKVTDWNWLPGTEAISGWKLPLEAVRSTMPHKKTSFTGISPISAGRDVSMTTGYPAAYQAWRNVSHVAAEWTFVPLKKDPEVFPSEGYLIKTRNTAEVNTVVPEAYLYSKFAIASGRNQLTFKTRNFSSTQPTYFKLTAIKEDGTVVHIAPSSNTAQSASAAEDGCWKFINNAGTKDTPNAYASFVYDLSQFNGSNVLLAFGVYNGVANSGENKLAFYSINLN
ncbi:MAG: carboxypeptidase regulatory-like domain-containing protein [Bacteroidota bacterium]|nr:carboxypeptidase regulatory-like domain-containing protein [Bacteroidota bacterium]